MQKKLLIVLLSFLSLMTIPFVANAATITSCTLDKETYLQGQTGYMTVRIYNDKEDEIQITELTATIDYYYTDENVYLQTFYASADLPIEIQQGHSNTFDIPFSLPTNIASGYTDIYVKAKTELWDSQSERWRVSDHPTYQQKLFIESPFKQQLEDQQAANQQLQTQLQEEQSINEYITKMAYFFGATTILLAAVTGFLIVLYRKTRIITQPTA
jgi:sporulation-control protein spo0M